MPPEHAALKESKQLLLVLSPGWESPSGTLYRYERAAAGAPWKLVDSTDVSLGRNGLGWGMGLNTPIRNGAPIKEEGDGKAPAGIFSLSTAFGYAPSLDREAHGDFPYLPLTKNTVAIEDPHSIHYNTILDQSRIPNRDWKSAEEMLRADALYRWGVVVDHNAHPGAQHPAMGSCIFLHVWRGPGKATAGCTAMAEKKLHGIVHWLKNGAEPRLVQLTQSSYAELAADWGLPAVPKLPSLLGWLPALVVVAAAVGLLRCFAQR